MSAQETMRELSGSEASDAIARVATATVGKPRLRLKLRDMWFQRIGRWIVVTVKYTGVPESNEITIRLSRAEAEALRLRLNRVLDV